MGFCLTACSVMDAARTEIEYHDLKLNTTSPNPLFLDAQPGDSVSLQIRDRSGFNIGKRVKEEVEQTLKMKGYEIVLPREARFKVQVVLTSNFSEKTAREIMGSPDTGAVAGGVAGGVIGAQKGTGAAIAGAAVGTAAGALADLTSSLVKVGRVQFDGVIRVLEKADRALLTETRTEIKQGSATSVSQEFKEEIPHKQFQSDFSVTAEKTGLEWEECEKPVLEAIIKEISENFSG